MSFSFGVKVVRPDLIATSRPAFTEPSDELRKCISEGKIKALYGLLGDNWEENMQRLVDHYWEPK